MEFSRRYNLIEIARSIADKGFTPRHAEALLVIEHPSEDGLYVVVEGNRRLATLQLLTDQASRHAVRTSSEWEELAGRAEDLGLQSSVPVIVYPGRDDLNDYLGFRHITGPRPWRPEAKGRFIAKLLRGGESIDAVVRRIGSNHRTVRRYAEASVIFEQAVDAQFPIDELEQGFGVFYNALDREGVRQFLGLGRQVQITGLPVAPVDEEHIDALRELIGLLYGDPGRGLDAVIRESRELRRLGLVLADDRARANLIVYRDLERAWRISGRGKDDVMEILSDVYQRLAEVNGKARDFADDDEIRADVQRIYELVLDMAERYRILVPPC